MGIETADMKRYDRLDFGVCLQHTGILIRPGQHTLKKTTWIIKRNPNISMYLPPMGQLSMRPTQCLQRLGPYFPGRQKDRQLSVYKEVGQNPWGNSASTMREDNYYGRPTSQGVTTGIQNDICKSARTYRKWKPSM